MIIKIIVTLKNWKLCEDGTEELTYLWDGFFKK